MPAPPLSCSSSSSSSAPPATADAAVPNALLASQPEPPPDVPLQAQSSRALTLAWLALLAITATPYWLGGGRVQAATGSMVPVLVLCALTFVKGMLVSLEFLELRHAPALWRWLVCGWLAVVLLLIALAFWVSHW